MGHMHEEHEEVLAADPGDELEKEDDLRFKERMHWAERIAQVLGLLVIAAALFGIFGGGGPIAGTRETSRSGEIDFDRIVRASAETRLEIKLRPERGAAGEVRINRDYFDDVELESVTPEPERIVTAGDHLAFIFPISEAPELRVTMIVKPRKAGRARAIVEGGGDHLVVSQLVLP
jgi:hypothetical protein